MAYDCTILKKFNLNEIGCILEVKEGVDGKHEQRRLVSVMAAERAREIKIFSLGQKVKQKHVTKRYRSSTTAAGSAVQCDGDGAVGEMASVI